ncbi:RHS repeat-associated core domain-containing protein, partial [Streptomyces sp. NPDC059095]
ARSYDPNLARFTTTDPSGQETNAYLYAEGDPINRTDPNGLFDFAATLAAAGAATAGAVVGNLVGGPILAGALGGCLGGAVGERTTGGSLKDAGESCLTWAALGALGGAATVVVPKA